MMFPTLTPIVVIVAPLIMASCTVIPTGFPITEFEVAAAASDFHREHGRWPMTRDELGSVKGSEGDPIDLRSLRQMTFHNRPDGGLEVRWIEGNEWKSCIIGVKISRPTAEPTTTRNAVP